MKMNFKSFINETMKMGEISQQVIDSSLEYLEKYGEHTGDQDGKQIFRAIYQNSEMYGIKNNNVITSFLTFSKSNDSSGYRTIGVAYTAPHFRNKKDLQRIFWFAKEHDKISFISSGVQSDKGQELMKALSKTGRFEMDWLNIGTKEKIKYDPIADTINSNNKFRSISKPTDWRIIIECAEKPIFESRYTDLVKNAWCVFSDSRENDIYE
jgi:hypothetical protein